VGLMTYYFKCPENLTAGSKDKMEDTQADSIFILLIHNFFFTRNKIRQ